MIVNNCKNCPFRVSDFNPDSVGMDTCDSCGLLNFKHDIFNSSIVCYDSYSDEPIPELQTVLSNCPLLKGEINIKYEKERTES